MAKFSFTDARRNMVDNQLRPNKVRKSALLQRFMDVPREEFADSSYQHQAYADTLLPIGLGRVMFAPMTLARMLQGLDITQEDNVLIVAGGTGYTAALLAPLVKHVSLVEEDGYLLDIAQKEAIDMNLTNITFKQQKPEKGFKDKAPYTRIIFDAAIEEIPESTTEQLMDGGKIGAVMQDNDNEKHATIYTKAGKTLFADALFETKAEVLANFKKQERFIF